MSQNVPNETEPDHSAPSITRLHQTAQKRIQEKKSYTQIAEDLGVNRRTILRDRQQYPDLYQHFINQFLNLYTQALTDLLNSPEKYLRVEGIKETGRNLRATQPHRIESRTLQIQAKLDLDSRRDYAQEVLEEVRSLDQGAYELMLRAMLSIDTNRSHEDS